LAREAGRLFHPGIVVILDVGQEGDIALIAMERRQIIHLERLGWDVSLTPRTPSVPDS